MSDLPRRLVAAPGWRWMQGMATTDGFVVTSVCDGDVCQYIDHKGYETTAGEQTSHEDLRAFVKEYWLPDLTDPATAGCILALVAETRKARLIVAFDGAALGSPGPSLTLDFADGSEEIHTEDTLAGCLVAAMEAPCLTP